MGSDYIAGVTDGASPSPETTSSTGTEPSIQGGEQVGTHYGNRVPDARIQQLIEGRVAAERREAQAQAQLQQVYQQIQRAQQAAQYRQQVQQGQPSDPQQRLAYAEGVEALLRLMNSDPRTRALLEQSRVFPQVAQGYQAARQATEMALNQRVAGDQARLAQMAQSSGLGTDGNSLWFLERAVRNVIEAVPLALEGYRNGDPNILPWAFSQVQQQWLNGITRQGQMALANAKANMSRLPPAGRTSGLPSNTPAPRFDPNNPRESVQKIHDAAFARLQELVNQ